MCGIVSIFNIKKQTSELREKALRMSQKLRHRGPDWSGIYCGGSAILAHERLSIVDPESGKQPLFSPDRKQVLAVNGEIYNHQEIRRRYAGRYDFQTGSDCEVILALYRDKGINFLEDISGIFAFALYDEEKDEFLIARDPIGVIPLYIGYDRSGMVYVASELKALEGQCDRYEPFLPGHYYWSKDPGMKRYFKRDWFDYSAVENNGASVEAIRNALRDSVKRQLMSDVPYGVLLSGGLDSSVISEQKFQLHCLILKNYDKSELFTIIGTEFYEDCGKLDLGVPLKLVKEPENEFDSDAIAVHVGDKKAGYVANSVDTKYELTSSASELQDKIPDICQGEYLLYLDRYSPIQFHIGKIIK